MLEEIDAFLGGLLAGVDLNETLVTIISDHGNIEDIRARGHTENLVPTVLIGSAHRQIADDITDLTDITPALLRVLDVALDRECCSIDSLATQPSQKHPSVAQ